MLQPKTTAAASGPRHTQLPPSAPGGDLVLGGARALQHDTLSFIQTLAAIDYDVFKKYRYGEEDFIKECKSYISRWCAFQLKVANVN